MPAMASASAYVASKLAATKIYETFGAENPEVEIVHIHPGVVYSELNVKSGVTAADDGMSTILRQKLTVNPMLTTHQLTYQPLSLYGLVATKGGFFVEAVSIYGATGTWKS